MAALGGAPSFPDGVNLYQYLRGNPLTLIDPHGTFSYLGITKAMGIQGLLGGLISGAVNKIFAGGSFAEGFVGGFIGGTLGGAAGSLVNSAFAASGAGLLAKMLIGSADGAVAGFSESLYLNEGDVVAALTDAAIGAALGGLTGGAVHKLADSNVYKRIYLRLASCLDQADEAITLSKRVRHILYGDATGGGHLWPGAPGKTPFPESWSAQKIIDEVEDIATDPALDWIQQTGRAGADRTRAGDPVRFVVEGVREGVRIKVVIEPLGEGIITAHPVP